MAPKTSKKKHYSSKCSYIGCSVKSTEKGLSFHQVPKNATEEQKSHWAKVCPEPGNGSTVRICSKHFLPSDFERDLRNEMLGLPLRHILKPGAYPRLPNEQIVPVQKVVMKLLTPKF